MLPSSLASPWLSSPLFAAGRLVKQYRNAQGGTSLARLDGYKTSSCVSSQQARATELKESYRRGVASTEPF